MTCLTSARGRLLNVSMAINRSILYCAYCLFFSSVYFCVRSCLLYICVCIIFPFLLLTTILANKDVFSDTMTLSLGARIIDTRL